MAEDRAGADTGFAPSSCPHPRRRKSYRPTKMTARPTVRAVRPEPAPAPPGSGASPAAQSALERRSSLPDRARAGLRMPAQTWCRPRRRTPRRQMPQPPRTGASGSFPWRELPDNLADDGENAIRTSPLPVSHPLPVASRERGTPLLEFLRIDLFSMMKRDLPGIFSLQCMISSGGTRARTRIDPQKQNQQWSQNSPVAMRSLSRCNDFGEMNVSP